MGKFYAVKVGKQPGVYETWEACQFQIKGYKGAQFKSFNTLAEAVRYLGISNPLTCDHLDDVHEILKDNSSVLENAVYENLVEKKIIKNVADKTKLTSEQKQAFDTLMSGENAFLSGEAGTGKSYVINAFIKEMEAQQKNVLVCAPTGIAALQIDGVTIHRCFKASLEPQVNTRIKIVPDEVKAADIIIIDEISMCRVDLFDYVARVIAKAEEVTLERKQLIVVGDFFQLPPVTTNADYEVLKKIYPNYDKGFAFESKNWEDFNFKKIVLKNVLRQSNTEFIKALNLIRSGNKEGITYFNENAKRQRIEKGIVLCATNKVADKINQEELEKIESRAKIYHAIIEGDVKPSDKPTSDEVRLKVGARVIILVNDTEMFQYQNGSMGTVTKLKNDSVEVELDQSGMIVNIGIYEWKIENYTLTQEMENGVSFNKLQKLKVGSFKQIPLKLAYAITIHKSQGQTYDKVNLIPYCFDCGQLYVALSRVKTIEGLCLIQLMKQEHLICNENVRKFYDIKDSKRLNFEQMIYANLGKAVLSMEINKLPLELRQLALSAKEKLNQQ